jgi:hypothetical protein
MHVSHIHLNIMLVYSLTDYLSLSHSLTLGELYRNHRLQGLHFTYPW